MVAAVVHEPIERNTLVRARVAVRDPETGRVGYLSPGSNEAFRRAEEFREKQLKVLTDKGVDRLDILAGSNVIPPLMKFFKKRVERMGRR
jgi:hypothetical protein